MKTIAQLINWDFGANGRLEIKDKKGNRTYFELADGFWARYEYDYNRPKPSEDKVVEIDGVKYKLIKL